MAHPHTLTTCAMFSVFPIPTQQQQMMTPTPIAPPSVNSLALFTSFCVCIMTGVQCPPLSSASNTPPPPQPLVLSHCAVAAACLYPRAFVLSALVGA